MAWCQDGPMAKSQKCSVRQCGRKVLAKGLCTGHYQRRRNNKPLDVPLGKPLTSAAERFWSRVKVGAPNECWPWLGKLDSHGRAAITVNGKRIKVHRFAWMLKNGPIPKLPDAGYHGTCILHTCDVGHCCNWGHLFPGTQTDNLHDMEAKGRGVHLVKIPGNPFKDC